MLWNESRHGDAIRALGLHVALTERVTPRRGEQRFLSLIATDAGRMVGEFWCERSGEWSGAGWIGVTDDYSTWSGFLLGLQAHRGVVAA